MGMLPLDQFLCWKLKVATIASAGYIIVTATMCAILEILDIAALADDSFDISGGFKAHWRQHVWEGWLAINIVLLVCHLIMIGASVVLILAVKRFPTFYEYNLTKLYMALMICYILVELGCGLYRYSWYAENTFRLPYLVFICLFWMLRTILNVTVCIILHSRLSELDYEIRYGEKKSLDPFSAQAALMRSGYSTPMLR